MVSESSVRAGTISVCSSLPIRVTESGGHRLQLQKQVNEVTGSEKGNSWHWKQQGMVGTDQLQAAVDSWSSLPGSILFFLENSETCIFPGNLHLSSLWLMESFSDTVSESTANP